MAAEEGIEGAVTVRRQGIYAPELGYEPSYSPKLAVATGEAFKKHNATIVLVSGGHHVE